MKKILPPLMLLYILFGHVPLTLAKDHTATIQVSSISPAQKKAHRKASASKAVAPSIIKMPVSSDAEDDSNEPDISGTQSTDFHCELGNTLTIFKNDADNKHIAIRWHQHINRLTRVATTTGANRFENHKTGLVWIGIPSKGLLLDAKKGQQLANECKNSEMLAAATAAKN